MRNFFIGVTTMVVLDTYRVITVEDIVGAIRPMLYSIGTWLQSM